MNQPEDINEAALRARQIIECTDTHLFLTGKAGTGKTTFLRKLKSEEPKRMVVLAPTGIAAINAGGSTIHSFFQLPFAPFIPNSSYKQMNFKLQKQKIKLIRSLDLIVIDEISMVRADLLDQIDAVLRQYRSKHQPFGGVQLLMIGDLQQLPPVAREQDWELLSQYYETPYFFSSHALKQTYYLTVELNKVYRQNDPTFLELLNKIRNNQADQSVLDALNRRYVPNFEPKPDEKYIRLMTHNQQAQEFNNAELAKITNTAFSFKAEVKGNFPESSYPTDALLTLKKGAQVMFVKNDLEKRYHNGTLGEVISLTKDCCIVRTNDTHIDIQVEPEEWENTRYALNAKTQEIEEMVEGCFKQLPLKLAWAITIHKSQGLTFERAIIDAHSAFAHGQTYVALSRCKTLEGLVLSSPIPSSAIIQDKAIHQFNTKMEAEQQRPIDINQLRNQHCLNLISQLFDFSAIRLNFMQLQRIIETHFRITYPKKVEEYADAFSKLHDTVFTVAEKFRSQYQRMTFQLDNGKISPELQERLQKGADYFQNAISPFNELVCNTTLPTDNKELKKRINNTKDDLKLEFANKTQLLAYVSHQGFDIIEYQKIRAKVAAGQQISSAGQALPAAEMRNSKPEKLDIPADILHPELYKMLSQWRAQKAEENKVPVYMVIQNKAMIGISNLRPKEKEVLQCIPYFGKTGMEKYGEELLEIVHQFEKSLPKEELERMDLQDAQLYAEAIHRKKEKIINKDETIMNEKETKSFEKSTLLFLLGKTVEEIARERMLTTSTIYSHLLDGVKANLLPLEKLIPEDRLSAISNFLRLHPDIKGESLSIIRAKMDNQYEYYEIRAVLDELYS